MSQGFASSSTQPVEDDLADYNQRLARQLLHTRIDLETFAAKHDRQWRGHFQDGRYHPRGHYPNNGHWS